MNFGKLRGLENCIVCVIETALLRAAGVAPLLDQDGVRRAARINRSPFPASVNVLSCTIDFA